MVSEHTPLLYSATTSADELHSLSFTEGPIKRVLALPLLALKHHYIGILTTIASGCMCWHLGHAESAIIDDLIFKSIFIIFGFTMGFRNVRANQRYFDAMQQAASFYAAFWGIYTPLPTEVRARVREELLLAVAQAVGHVHRVSADRRHCWYGIVGFEPTSDFPDVDLVTTKPPDPDAPELGLPCAVSVAQVRSISLDSTLGQRVLSATTAVLAPRSRLIEILQGCEGEIETLEPGREQKLKRNFWLHRQQFLHSYDMLLALAMPSVTERFVMFVDMCLFFFAVTLPWGIKAKSIGHGPWKISSGVVLLLTTTLVVMVMFTLNALTLQNEDPLSGDAGDIDLNRLTTVLEIGVAAYEKERSAKEQRNAFRGKQGSPKMLAELPE